jgi:hypothetical protein
MAKRRLRQSATPLNLDSLVDIVSNNVGILVILAAFMAMFALVNPRGSTGDPASPHVEPPPKRLRVPWSHPTTKNSVYVILRHNRLLPVDLRTFFERLAALPSPDRMRPLEVELPRLLVKFFPVTNEIYCLEFEPDAESGETWLQAQQPQSAWQAMRAAYPAERYVYFFWVEGDSFELFRELRGHLWDEQVEVGWKPVEAEQPLAVCNGFEDAGAFQPQ